MHLCRILFRGISLSATRFGTRETSGQPKRGIGSGLNDRPGRLRERGQSGTAPIYQRISFGNARPSASTYAHRRVSGNDDRREGGKGMAGVAGPVHLRPLSHVLRRTCIKRPTERFLALTGSVSKCLHCGQAALARNEFGLHLRGHGGTVATRRIKLAGSQRQPSAICRCVSCDEIIEISVILKPKSAVEIPRPGSQVMSREEFAAKYGAGPRRSQRSGLLHRNTA